ncbi:MAG: SRPBCC domain-containing protein [Pseudomonadota bacterium]
MKRIKHSRVLPFPAEILWEALTDSAQIEKWLMANDFKPVVGHTFQFRTDPAPGFDGIVNCKVTKVEPPTLLQYSWAGGGIDTIVTYTLEPVDGGTKLTVEQVGFKLSNIIPRIILGAGWKRILRDKIPAALTAITNGHKE